MTATLIAAASRLVCGPTVQWHTNPHVRRQRIYFANHSSHFDFAVIWSALPAQVRTRVRPVAGRDYWEHGMVRRYLAVHVFHAVLIERTTAGASSPLAAARASIARMAA